MLPQAGLDITGFDPVAPELELGIQAAEILQRAIGQLTAAITGEIAAHRPGARDGPDTKAPGILLRRQIAVDHAAAAHPQLTGLARRHGTALRIKDKHMPARQRCAQIPATGLGGIIRAVDPERHLAGGLGQCVGTDQPGGMLPLRPRGDVIAPQRLAAEREPAQPTAVHAAVKIGDRGQAPVAGGRLAQDRDALLHQQFAERDGVLPDMLRHHDQAPAVAERAPDLPDGKAEGRRVQPGPDIPRAEIQSRDQRREKIQQIRVGNRHTLRHPGGT